MMTRSTWIRIAAGSTVLTAAVVCTGLLFASNAPAESRPPEARPLAVNTIPAGALEGGVDVRTTGVVRSRHSVQVQPQVAGRVAWVADDWRSGRYIGAGDVLFRIEREDHELRLVQRQAALTAAEVELQLEAGRGEVAASAWASLGEEGGGQLARREPQRRMHEAQVASARAQVRQAELDLARTTVRAPFDALVVSADASPGQLLGAGQAVGQLVAADAFEVEVPVRAAELALLRDAEPHAITVTVRPTHSSLVYPAHIDGITGSIDEATRNPVVRVVLDEVPHGAELLPGAFVEVTLAGPTHPDLVSVPVSAVDGASRVWVAEPDDTLGVRHVDLAARGREVALVAYGVDPGERVVVVPPSLPVVGTALRVTDASTEVPHGR